MINIVNILMILLIKFVVLYVSVLIVYILVWVLRRGWKDWYFERFGYKRIKRWIKKIKVNYIFWKR